MRVVKPLASVSKSYSRYVRSFPPSACLLSPSLSFILHKGSHTHTNAHRQRGMAAVQRGAPVLLHFKALFARCPFDAHYPAAAEDSSQTSSFDMNLSLILHTALELSSNSTQFVNKICQSWRSENCSSGTAQQLGFQVVQIQSHIVHSNLLQDWPDWFLQGSLSS